MVDDLLMVLSYLVVMPPAPWFGLARLNTALSAQLSSALSSPISRHSTPSSGRPSGRKASVSSSSGGTSASLRVSAAGRRRSSPGPGTLEDVVEEGAQVGGVGAHFLDIVGGATGGIGSQPMGSTVP
jgi:hypothetical protein